MTTPSKLRKAYPDRCVTKSTLWTPSGARMETIASHEPEHGKLLACLLAMTGPRNAAEREAMAELLRTIRATNAEAPS